MVNPWDVKVGSAYLWYGEYHMTVKAINAYGWVDFTAPNGSTHNMPLQDFANAVSEEPRQ